MSKSVNIFLLKTFFALIINGCSSMSINILNVKGEESNNRVSASVPVNGVVIEETPLEGISTSDGVDLLPRLPYDRIGEVPIDINDEIIAHAREVEKIKERENKNYKCENSCIKFLCESKPCINNCGIILCNIIFFGLGGYLGYISYIIGEAQ